MTPPFSDHLSTMDKNIGLTHKCPLYGGSSFCLKALFCTEISVILCQFGLLPPRGDVLNFNIGSLISTAMSLPSADWLFVNALLMSVLDAKFP